MNHTQPPFPLNPRCALLCALLLSSPFAIADTKALAKAEPTKEMPEMTVTDTSTPIAAETSKERYKLPATTESITAKQIDNTINAMSAEDVIKYMPSITVRKRYAGDTNAPVAWRTSGTGMSARGLIYADGIMLSSLLGNNNGNTGSPRWNMVSPNEIERVDVMYGPFSAAYSGNSIGGVIEMTTKMPEKFEAGADIKSSWQTYGNYGHNQTFDTQEYAFNLGDRMKDFSWRFDVSHLDAHSQPISYVNPLVASTTTKATTADVAVNGAVPNLNPYGQPAIVQGAGNMNHTVQDTFKWKLAYDITPTIKAAYTLGLWQNDNHVSSDSFLTNAKTGEVVNTGNVNINGMRYTLAPNAFGESRAEQLHWSHGMNIKSNTGGIFDWDLSGSVVDYGKDISRTSTQTPNQAGLNGAGTVTSLTGTGWHTADAKGIWRPTAMGQHEVSFGFHHDLYSLKNPVYTVTNWQSNNGAGVPTGNSQGKTQTEAYWAQDSWDFYKNWNLTLGGRLESWHAYDGVNSATVNGRLQTVNQANNNATHFSPKFKLTWEPMERVKIGASVAQAYRFATATELFQTNQVIVGGQTTITNGNPNLKPEEALSSELATEYLLDKGKLRLSLFQERINNAIYSQPGITSTGTVISSPQNVRQIETYGIEFAGEKSDVGIQGLDLSGNATWADSRITKNSDADAAAALQPFNSANPYANLPTVGARQPRVPEWRASATVAYRPTDKWTNSVSMRYSSKQFSALNNADTNGGTYTGNTAFFVVDLRTKYQITKQLAVAGGIDNVNNNEYWIFHPFPMRTYFAELKFNY
jgi:iron complex outermembrane receptor protein